MIRAGLPLLLAAALVAAPFGREQPLSAGLTRVRQTLGLSPSDFAVVDRGDVLAKALEKHDKRYVGAVGVSRFSVPPAFLVQRLRDIKTFKKNHMVLALGVFSSPPATEDLLPLSLDRSDIDALRNCRAGDCGLQISAEQLRLLKAANLFQPGVPPAAVERWLRGVLAAYAANYAANGNRALLTYIDDRDPVSLEAETATIIAQADELDQAPGLRAHLTHFPADRVPGAEDVLYWSKEAFGLKPVISMTHVTLVMATDVAEGVTVMSSKQIYASHYLDASLAVTLVVPVPNVPSAVYVAYVSRSRTKIPGGIFAPIARSIVQRRTIDGMRNTLADTRTRIEADYRASRAAATP